MPSIPASSEYGDLRTFADVKALLDAVATHVDLCSLNDAVTELSHRDEQPLIMTDNEWNEFTRLVVRKASQLGNLTA